MAIVTYLVYFVLVLPLSLLPFRLLYGISDLLAPLLYHVVGYRREVVLGNLRQSFPEKPEKEIRGIAKAFYRHFCDIFFAETLKSFTISARTQKNRLQVKDPEVLQELYKKGKSVIIVCGHYGLWELFAAAPLHKDFPFPLKAIYKVQKNKVADRLIYRSRTKFGVELVAMENVRQSFEQDRNRQNAIIFLGDQSPSNPQSAYWTHFLGRETGVLFGTEKMAKVFDYAVVFSYFKEVKRGQYELHFRLITDNPKQTQKGEITEAHTRMLEEVIRTNPSKWLWSHRRWKHSKPEVTK